MKKNNKLLFNQNKKKVISILSRKRANERKNLENPLKVISIPNHSTFFLRRYFMGFLGLLLCTTFCLTLFMARHVLLSESKISLLHFRESQSLCQFVVYMRGNRRRRIMDSWTAKKERERHKKKNDNFVASNLSPLKPEQERTYKRTMRFYVILSRDMQINVLINNLLILKTSYCALICSRIGRDQKGKR